MILLVIATKLSPLEVGVLIAKLIPPPHNDTFAKLKEIGWVRPQKWSHKGGAHTLCWGPEMCDDARALKELQWRT